MCFWDGNSQYKLRRLNCLRAADGDSMTANSAANHLTSVLTSSNHPNHEVGLDKKRCRWCVQRHPVQSHAGHCRRIVLLLHAVALPAADLHGGGARVHPGPESL